MNYIELINQFWRTRRTKTMTSNDADLYFFLIQECNLRGWVNPFGCPNTLITATIGLRNKSIISSRNALKQKGLIDFQQGNRNSQIPVYEILVSTETKNETKNEFLVSTETKNETKNGNIILNKTKTKNKTFLENSKKENFEILENSDFVSTDEKPEKEKSCAKKEKGETGKSLQDFPEKEAALGSGVDFSFEHVWELYGKKGNRKTSERRWANLKNSCREAALKHIPPYVASTPDKQFRKNFETYLNQEAWNDEIVAKKVLKSSKIEHNRQMLNEILKDIQDGKI